MNGETDGKVTENLNPKEHRRALFSVLGHVLATAKTKFDMEKAANGDRLKWGRLIVSGVEAYGRLLEGVQLEQLEQRLTALEQKKTEEE
jgi:hypothetical protein